MTEVLRTMRRLWRRLSLYYFILCILDNYFVSLLVINYHNFLVIFSLINFFFVLLFFLLTRCFLIYTSYVPKGTLHIE
jgi:hypothetical protein